MSQDKPFFQAHCFVTTDRNF